jgi:hypothetical protein
MNLRILAMTLCLLAAVASQAVGNTLFKLEALRSGTRFGPFAFQNGAPVRTDTGVFRLDLRQGNAFTLVSTADASHVYGVYELTVGRIIEVGDGVFTIVDVVESPVRQPTGLPPATATATDFWKGYFVGAEIDLFSSVIYDWKADGLTDGKAKTLDRNAMALVLGRGVFAAKFGIVTGAEWDHRIVGNAASFQNATLDQGRGWFVALGTRIPIFQQGHWQAHVTGDVAYRQEDYQLGYSTVSISGVTSTFATNITQGVTNIQPVSVTTNLQFAAIERDASLTETSLRVGVDLVYAREFWSAHAAIHVFPVLETELEAGIRTIEETIDLEFERAHPIVISGGLSADILGVQWSLEGDVGSETTLRVGVRKTF